MPLTLTKEDGTGLTGANSYANATDGDAYHEGHLYASAWTAATLANKEKALVMATRLIDAHYQFSGTRSSNQQALQWPREDCRDPDANADWVGQRFVPSDDVPKGVLEATCETARALILEDRTTNPLGEGLSFSALGDLSQSFDKGDRRPVIPHAAQAMLNKFGVLARQRSGAVPLLRS